MKLLFLLVLSYWTLNTFAGGLAGAYERMMLWYAYEIEHLGPTRLIAPGCPAPCNFKTFMETIDDYSDTREILFDPKNRIPDLHETAQYMFSDSWVPDRYEDPSRIVLTAGTSYNKMLEAVANIVATSTADRAQNFLLFNSAIEAMQNARDLRYVDWSRLTVNDLRTRTSLTISETDTETGNGRAFNYGKTINHRNNAGISDIKAKLDEAITFLNDVDPARQAHWQPIVTLMDAVEIQGGHCA